MRRKFGKTRLLSFQFSPFFPQLFRPISPCGKAQPSALPVTGPHPVPGALLPPSGGRQLDPSVVWSQSASLTLNLLEILEHYKSAGSLCWIYSIGRTKESWLFSFLPTQHYQQFCIQHILYFLSFNIYSKYVSSHFRYWNYFQFPCESFH